ncbi:MAG: DUF721 domain-containing protein [Bradymonadales bacterium]|nr:DUF721 domain-containing protein [Bradymonadales bacterium]
MLGFEPVVRAYLAWVMQTRGQLTLEALQAVWPILVGSRWSQQTRLKSWQGGRLEVLVCDPIWHQELRFQSEALLRRLNGLLPAGAPRVKRLGLSIGELPPVTVSEPTAAPRRGGPLTAQQAEAVGQIEDPTLRELVRRVVGGCRDER